MRRSARKCTSCGQHSLGPARPRADLLAALERVEVELGRYVPHPVPPKVRTYEQLERHELEHDAMQRGTIGAVVGSILDTEVRRLCWDCLHKRDSAESERRRLELDELLANVRGHKFTAIP